MTVEELIKFNKEYRSGVKYKEKTIQEKSSEPQIKLEGGVMPVVCNMNGVRA